MTGEVRDFAPQDRRAVNEPSLNSRPSGFSWADCVSPLDYRYYGPNERLFAKVHPYLSEAATLRYFLRVEAALARGLAATGVCTPEQAEEIARACDAVTFE